MKTVKIPITMHSDRMDLLDIFNGYNRNCWIEIEKEQDTKDSPIKYLVCFEVEDYEVVDNEN